MAESHLQLNADATTATRKTTLWPTDKAAQQKVILSLFEQPNWTVSAIKNVSGSHWKVETYCGSFSWKINLFISSIRDESRQPDEFKMQLGSTYPESEEDGWINLVLGIYTIEDGINPTEYILSGYNIERYDFSTNPSLRGTRTSGLQKAKVFGMCVTDKSVLFRPDFIYYYIETQSKKSLAHFNESKIQKELINPIFAQFYVAIRTKPFLLLAGISGTGKSRIVKEFAFDSCPNDTKLREDETRPGNYCLIEVKPNWHDSSELLGYQSAIAKTYVLTPFVKFLAKAMLYPDVPFFVCLDEMNLAPVEQYLAEFLSVLESRKKLESGEIVSEPLIKADVFKANDLRKALFFRVKENNATYDNSITDDPESEYSNAKEQAIYEILKRDGLRIPQNVIVIGTVNMDETTHQFSRKVIDRAMTIEMNLPEGDPFMDFFKDFRELGYRDAEQPKELYLASEVSADKVVAKLRENNESKTNDWLLPEVAKTLTALNEALEGTPFKVAYRVQNEMMLYFGELWKENREAKWREILTTTVDQILMMKVLPRIEGDEDLLEEPLERLATFCANYPHAAKKVTEMKERLSRSHFASYWP